MKCVVWIFCLFVSLVLAVSSSAAVINESSLPKDSIFAVVSSTSPFSGGTGTSTDPFLISTTADLIDWSTQSFTYSAYFQQTQDIAFPEDYSSFDWNGDGLVNASDASGFDPINFNGTYDGADHSISYLYINRQGGFYNGLFGSCSGTVIENLTLIGASVTGSSYVGALVGFAYNLKIENCAVYADVKGNQHVGGVVGYVASSAKGGFVQVASYANVSGSSYIGGFVGSLSHSVGTGDGIKNCYSSGTVKGVGYVGGFAGKTSSYLQNVYSKCVDLSSTGAGLASEGTVSSSYYDMELFGSTNSSIGVACSSNAMTDVATYVGWDFSDGGIWSIDPSINDGYPYLNSVGCLHVETVFNGIGDWDDASLWSNGVPDASTTRTAVINGQCTLNSDVAIQKVIVSAGSSLNISSGVVLDVIDKVLLETNSTPDVGELLFEDNEVLDIICQEKYFKPGQWTFICCPYDLPAKDLFPNLQMATSWAALGADYWVVRYDQGTRSLQQSGMTPIYDEDEVLTTAMGYMIWVDSEQMASFKYENAKASGNVGIACTLSQTVTDAGWNLVGNPYAFSMTYADIFDCAMNSADLTTEIHVWDITNQRYATWQNGVGDLLAETVEPLEAFFVKSSIQGDSHFCMTRGACGCSAPTGTTLLKSTHVESDLNVLTIIAEVNGFDDMTFLRIDDKATSHLDHSLDAIKMDKDVSVSPAIFTSDADGVDCSINSFSLEEGDVMLDLPVLLPSDAESLNLSFKVDGSLSYEYFFYDSKNADLVLIENELKIEVRDVQSVDSRFMILAKNTTVDDISTDLNFVIDSGVSFVRCSGLVGRLQIESLTDQDISYSVYDYMGRLVKSGDMNGVSCVDLSLLQGVYIVRIECGDSPFVKSIIIE